MAKIPSSKLSEKTSKKTGVVMVIAVGGKAPKKPTKTADTKKSGSGACGVTKATRACACGTKCKCDCGCAESGKCACGPKCPCSCGCGGDTGVKKAPEGATPTKCPNCGKSWKGGSVCPHCAGG